MNKFGEFLSIADCVKHHSPSDTWDWVLLDMAVELRNKPRRYDEALFYYLWWESLPQPEFKWAD